MDTEETTRLLKRRQNEDVDGITSSVSPVASSFMFTTPQPQHESSSSSCCIGTNPWISWGIIRHTLMSPSSNSWGGDGAATTTSHQDNDLLLAEEMNRLSFEERERVYEDINGVGKPHEESPIFIQKCIKELDEILGKGGTMSQGKLRNYLRALFLQPNLQRNDKFKLMFLRADLYDAEKAADRMVKYFELKLELFGASLLTKQIAIDDLSEDDLMYIRSGFIVDLPFRDQSGRPVILVDYSCLDPSATLTRENIKSGTRCFFYMIMAAIENCEVAQKLGICIVTYCAGFDKWNSTGIKGLLGSMQYSGSACQSVPCRLTSFRVCYDDPRLQFIINAMKYALGQFTSTRVRTHLGSDLEHDYFLMSVGIPYKGLFQKTKQQQHQRRSPSIVHTDDITDDAGVGFHESYIQRRQIIDRIYQKEKFEKEQKLGIVEHPSVNDVLIGRGRSYQSHAGNQFWNRLLLANIQEYRNSTNNFEKTCISMDMVKIIVKDRKGRFLQRTEKTNKEGGGPGWKILSEIVAREKTASAFRTRLSVLSNNKNDYGSARAGGSVKDEIVKGNGHIVAGRASDSRKNDKTSNHNIPGSTRDNKIGLSGGAITARDAKRSRQK